MSLADLEGDTGNVHPLPPGPFFIFVHFGEKLGVFICEKVKVLHNSI